MKYKENMKKYFSDCDRTSGDKPSGFEMFAATINN